MGWGKGWVCEKTDQEGPHPSFTAQRSESLTMLKEEVGGAHSVKTH